MHASAHGLSRGEGVRAPASASEGTQVVENDQREWTEEYAPRVPPLQWKGAPSCGHVFHSAPTRSAAALVHLRTRPTFGEMAGIAEQEEAGAALARCLHRWSMPCACGAVTLPYRPLREQSVGTAVAGTISHFSTEREPVRCFTVLRFPQLRPPTIARQNRTPLTRTR